MKKSNVSAKVFEYVGDCDGINSETGSPSKLHNLWRIVPRICGNCPLAYESTKCKRTSCRVKSMARRGIPAVY
jgi:hypothetical protein